MEMKNPAGSMYSADQSTEEEEQTETEGLKVRPEEATSNGARKW